MMVAGRGVVVVRECAWGAPASRAVRRKTRRRARTANFLRKRRILSLSLSHTLSLSLSRPLFFILSLSILSMYQPFRSIKSEVFIWVSFTTQRLRTTSTHLHVMLADDAHPALQLQDVHALAHVRQVVVPLQESFGVAPMKIKEGEGGGGVPFLSADQDSNVIVAHRTHGDVIIHANLLYYSVLQEKKLRQCWCYRNDDGNDSRVQIGLALARVEKRATTLEVLREAAEQVLDSLPPLGEHLLQGPLLGRRALHSPVHWASGKRHTIGVVENTPKVYMIGRRAKRSKEVARY